MRRKAIFVTLAGFLVLAYELAALKFRCWPTVSDYCPWIHHPSILWARPAPADDLNPV